MNSLRYGVKNLRLLNLKTSLSILKESKAKPIQFENIRHDLTPKAKIYFSPHNIGLEICENNNGLKIQRDPLTYTPIVNPRSILPLIDTWQKDEIALPPIDQEEKLAIRLIVIRRKKMKKHQRRKLWKRMRHRWARVKKNRRIKKEKIFQNELLALVKEANEFSAEQYVASKLEKANHTPLPKRWKHKRLPEFIIRQLMGIDKKVNYRHTDVFKA